MRRRFGCRTPHRSSSRVASGPLVSIKMVRNAIPWQPRSFIVLYVSFLFNMIVVQSLVKLYTCISLACTALYVITTNVPPYNLTPPRLRGCYIRRRRKAVATALHQPPSPPSSPPSSSLAFHPPQPPPSCEQSPSLYLFCWAAAGLPPLPPPPRGLHSLTFQLNMSRL